MSVEDLLALKSKIEEELCNKGASTILMPGRYLVGVDIAAGIYDLTPYGIGEHDCWSFNIYLNADSKKELEKVEAEFTAAWYAAQKAEKPLPTPMDYSPYIIVADYNGYNLTNRPMRITLQDGQVMEMEYVQYSGTMKIVISKAEPLFMD